MRSKNSKLLNTAERYHLAWVKSQPCVLCATSEPSFAHHIVQGDHYTTLPLCWDCHQGPQGIHGDKTLWRVFKQDELGCLNILIGNLQAQARIAKWPELRDDNE